MESEQNQQYRSDDGQPGDIEPSEQAMDRSPEPAEVVPGAPVVRSNTPRPLSFNMLLAASGHAPEEQAEPSTTRSTFPSEAPVAPPLPEELESAEKESAAGDVEMTPENVTEPQEFVWLFEYGLEMDSAILNSAERLDGAAFLYGPAVLKGYALMFAEVANADSSSRHLLTTIVPRLDPGVEVWGILYRIPRHVTTHNSGQPSLLDAVHSSGTPRSLFRPAAVVVREIYREREISCGTYMLTDNARRQLRLLTVEQTGYDTPLVQRLASLARKQKFPEKYLNISARTLTTAVPTTTERATDYASTPLPLEQNTDPIPILKEKSASSIAITRAQKLSAATSSRLLIVLAIYLVLILLLVLIFAILQGLGFASGILTPDVVILGVPWLVLFYGLLGSSVSSLVALARSRQVKLPLFAIVLWFARPYLGIVLAALAYLLFNSGLFVIAEAALRHLTLLPLLGALAGFSEGWLFFRRSP